MTSFPHIILTAAVSAVICIAAQGHAQEAATPAPVTTVAPAAPLPLPAPAPTPAASDTAATTPGTATPPAPPAATPAPNTSQPQAAGAVPQTEDIDIPSIMFKPAIIQRLDEEIARISASLQTTAKPAKMDDDLLSQLLASQPKEKEAAPEVPIEKTFPIFYLNSIIYTSRAQWSVRINGLKFTNWNNDPQHSFFIAAIDKEHVTVQWKPVGIWPDLTAIWNQVKGNTDKHLPLQTIKLDDATNSVLFTLRPNQTFLSKAMQIREGHYAKDIDMIHAKNPAGTTP